MKTNASESETVRIELDLAGPSSAALPKCARRAFFLF